MTKDEREAEVLEKLERLRAEVEAETELKKARAARLRAEEEKRRQEQLALVKAERQRALAPDAPEEESEHRPGMLSRLLGRVSAKDALEIASEARGELDRPREKKEKSLLLSGGLSLFLGPLGWLYAGSFRESIPAALLWLVAASILSRLPVFLVWPVVMVALPISAIAGFVYAWQYNRDGKRCRILGDDKKKKLKS